MEIFTGLMAIGIAGVIAFWGPLRKRAEDGLRSLGMRPTDGTPDGGPSAGDATAQPGSTGRGSYGSTDPLGPFGDDIRKGVDGLRRGATHFRRQAGERLGASLGQGFTGRALWNGIEAGMDEDQVRRALLGRVERATDAQGHTKLRADTVHIENLEAQPWIHFHNGRVDRIVLDFRIPDDADARESARQRLTGMLASRYGQEAGVEQSDSAQSSVWRNRGRTVELRTGLNEGSLQVWYFRDGSSAL